MLKEANQLFHQIPYCENESSVTTDIPILYSPAVWSWSSHLTSSSHNFYKWRQYQHLLHRAGGRGGIHVKYITSACQSLCPQNISHYIFMVIFLYQNVGKIKGYMNKLMKNWEVNCLDRRLQLRPWKWPFWWLGREARSPEHYSLNILPHQWNGAPESK